MSKVTINVNNPVDVKVPDTGGMIASSTGMLNRNTNATANNNMMLPIAIVFVAIFAILVTVVIRRRYLPSRSFQIKSKKRFCLALTSMTLVILASIFMFLTVGGDFSSVEAKTAQAPSTLSVTADDVNIDIELDDEPVYEMRKSVVKVEQATDSGYSLFAYVNGETADLVNTTNKESKDVIASLDTSYSQALSDNTWGMSFTLPQDQDSPVFRGLPAGYDNAMIIKNTNESTDANDETTLYYATYVVPGLGEGAYTGITVGYIAVANVVLDDSENVTVKYHSGEYTFEEDDAGDENVMVYGKQCDMVYVGKNCDDVYKGEIEIVKTDNIADDGVAESNLSTTEDTLKSVTIEGADYLEVELTYGVNVKDSVYVYLSLPEEDAEKEASKETQRAIVEKESLFSDYYDVFSDSKWDLEGETTTQKFIVPGDTVYLEVARRSGGIKGAMAEEAIVAKSFYGYYAKVSPIYNEKPSGVETTKDTICHISKTSNIDDDGNKISPYADEMVRDKFTFADADKVKVELSYGVTADTGFVAIRGNNLVDYDFSPIEDSAGKKDFIIDDNEAYITLGTHGDELMENYDYGFYAKIYPVYDEEKAGTTPMQYCYVTNVSGSYMDVIENHDGWQGENPVEDTDPDAPTPLPRKIWIFSEEEMRNFLESDWEKYVGKTIDLHIFKEFIETEEQI